MGYWSIILPEATKNYLTNPSIEVDATGLTNYSTGSASGTRARDTSWSKRGRASYKLVKSGGGASDKWGAYQVPTALSEMVSGDYVTFSVDLNVTAGTVTIQLDVTQGTTLSATLAVVGPAAGRYSVTVGPLGATATDAKAYVYISSATGTVYADGWQVERKAYATTYIDGAHEGGTWLGAAHAAASTRDAQWRGGGREYNFDSYGFYVEQMTGLGMPPVKHLLQDYGGRPGALHRGVKVGTRPLTLAAVAIGTSHADLHSKRKAFIDAARHDKVKGDQPVLLRYSGANSAKACEIWAWYDTGLEFGKRDGFSEDVPLRFLCTDPLWYEDGEAAAALTTSQSIANANYILLKDETGVWSNMASGLTGATADRVRALSASPDESKIYVGGSFTQAGAVANTDGIAQWNVAAATWAALGTGVATGGGVEAIAIAPNGDVYVGGGFTDMGGVANTLNIAYWDGSAWHALSTGANSNVYALAFGPDGTLYVGGLFTTIGGVSCANIAKWNGTAFSALGTGAAGTTLGVRALSVGPDGQLYAGGDFTGMGGVSNTACIARWDGAWHSMAGGLSGSSPCVYALRTLRNGTIAVGGSGITTWGGVSFSGNVMRWSGTAFLALAGGVNGPVIAIAEDADGHILVGGGFDARGDDASFPLDRFALYNGSVWAHFDVDPPGDSFTKECRAILITPLGRLVAGFDEAGTALAAARQTVTTSCTTPAAPTLVVTRTGGTSARVLWLKNETTGATLWLNYALLAGETLTLDLTPGARSCVSSIFGPVWRAVLQNSDMTFGLAPGDNALSVFVDPVGSPTIDAYLQWRTVHWSADGVAA